MKKKTEEVGFGKD